jgi:hypothetical protein
MLEFHFSIRHFANSPIRSFSFFHFECPLQETQEQRLNFAKELATASWKEDGCISYDFVRCKDEADRFVIVEQ